MSDQELAVERLLARLVEVLERPSVLVAVDRLRRGAGQ